MTKQQQGASSGEDRAVVNGAASVSAVPASVPSAAHFVAYDPRLHGFDHARLMMALGQLARMVGREVCDINYGAWNPKFCAADATDRARRVLGEIANCVQHYERQVAQAIEARRAETTGSACESAVGEADASTILNDICNQSAEALKPLGESE